MEEQKPESADTLKRNQQAPFPFEYVEQKLRKKNFGVLSTISQDGSPHSVGVVYAVGPPDAPFCLYLITRPVLKKARNIHRNPAVSFVVPFPHYLFRSLPPACIQFQGKAELISTDVPAAVRSFQSSLVLRRSMEHSLNLGESIFIRLVPDGKIFTFGIGAGILKYVIQSQNKNLGNYYVQVPVDRQFK